MLVFLKLYLAHLIADFILQPEWIARNKQRISPLIAHSFIHFLTALILINTGLTGRIFLVLVVLGILHAISDYIKSTFTQDNWLAFTSDQIVHLVIIIGASIWLSTDPASNSRMVFDWLTKSEKIYLYLCAYIGVTFGGGYFVQKVTQYFMQHIDPDLVQKKPGLRNAGKYIGWLERSLVLTFIASGYPDGVGLLLAAKALARYPEIKDDTKGHLAEYVLIGTLTSVSVALAAAFALIKIRAIVR